MTGRAEQKVTRKGNTLRTKRHRWSESSYQTGDRTEFWERVAERQRLINWKIPHPLN